MLSVRPLSVTLIACGLVSGFALLASALEAEEVRDRGVVLYLNFDGRGTAAVSRVGTEPTVSRNVVYESGQRGTAISLHPGTPKEQDGSLFHFPGRGIIGSERGTVAFWIWTPWAGNDPKILKGGRREGPILLSIASRDRRTPFFRLARRKNFVDARFHTECGWQGPLMRSWPERWKARTWYHVTISWDIESGMDVFLDGEPMGGIEGPLECPLASPDLISFGASSRHGTFHLGQATAEMRFDDFVVLDHAIARESITMLMRGGIASLPERVAARAAVSHVLLQKLRLEPGLKRRDFRAGADGVLEVAIEQLFVGAVDLDFPERWRLVDGRASTEVVFAQDEFEIPRRARFALPEGRKLDHAIISIEDGSGRSRLEATGTEPLALPSGRLHVALPAAERSSVDVAFAGGARAREVAFYNSTAKPASGERQALGGRSSLAESMVELPRLAEWLEYDGGPVIVATDADREETSRFEAGAFKPWFVAGPVEARTRHVAAIHLSILVRPGRPRSTWSFQIDDPQLTGRSAFAFDADFEFADASGWQSIELTLRPAALIVPEGRRLILRIASNVDHAFSQGESRATLSIVDGDPTEIGRDTAVAALRHGWDAFRRGVNSQRNFRSVAGEINPVREALKVALAHDPDNELARSWSRWARYEPWPRSSPPPVDAGDGPEWAVRMRAAVRSMEHLLEFWMEHRSLPNGYLIGEGNQWNDITKLYANFLVLGAISSNASIVDTMERYLDAHWNSGRMKSGYSALLTDIVHSAEEATYLQPSFHVLRPGVPRHVMRDIETTANLDRWMGRSRERHLHFRSSDFTSDRMLENAQHASDSPWCATVLEGPRYLAWFNGHPGAGRAVAGWTQSWALDLLRTPPPTDGSAAGASPSVAPPSGILFPGDQLLKKNPSFFPLVADALLSVHQLTGDPNLLQPLRVAARNPARELGGRWELLLSPALLTHRIVSGELLARQALLAESRRMLDSMKSQDAFYPRGIERVEALAILSWLEEQRFEDASTLLEFVRRNNERAWPILGPSDPPVDRVYPWGRTALPVLMLGGRLFDGRGAAPHPTAAFLWDGIDEDLVSLVIDRRSDSGWTMLVHNFGSSRRTARLRVLAMPEGRYRVVRSSAAAPLLRETLELRRFDVAEFVVPPGTHRFAFTLDSPRSVRPRADLAVTLAQGSLMRLVHANVYNLGGAAANPGEVHLVSEDGETIARAVHARLDPASGDQVRHARVRLAVPPGVDLSRARLVVDPENLVDEIVESNNTYSLNQGIPPAVESVEAGH